MVTNQHGARLQTINRIGRFINKNIFWWVTNTFFAGFPPLEVQQVDLISIKQSMA